MQSFPLQNLDRGNQFPRFPLLDFQNNVGQLTLPNIFYPTFSLGFSNFEIPNIAPEIPEPIAETDQSNFPSFWDLMKGPLWGDVFGEGTISEKIDAVIKKSSLILFALVLIILGLYFLAKSTDTGAAVINVAKKI